jgi:hypothetical protein
MLLEDSCHLNVSAENSCILLVAGSRGRNPGRPDFRSIFESRLSANCRQWSVLARSYEFVNAAVRFFLDAKRTDDVNAGHGELVLLPSSPASREAGHLLRPLSETRAIQPRR